MSWKTIDTRPDEGESIAYDPVSKKQDVCYATTEDTYGYLDVTSSGVPYSDKRGKVGSRKSCSAAQCDGEYGPDHDEFMGRRATHWQPLPEPPSELPRTE